MNGLYCMTNTAGHTGVGKKKSKIHKYSSNRSIRDELAMLDKIRRRNIKSPFPISQLFSFNSTPRSDNLYLRIFTMQHSHFVNCIFAPDLAYYQFLLRYVILIQIHFDSLPCCYTTHLRITQNFKRTTIQSQRIQSLFQKKISLPLKKSRFIFHTRTLPFVMLFRHQFP